MTSLSVLAKDLHLHLDENKLMTTSENQHEREIEEEVAHEVRLMNHNSDALLTDMAGKPRN